MVAASQIIEVNLGRPFSSSSFSINRHGSRPTSIDDFGLMDWHQASYELQSDSLVYAFDFKSRYSLFVEVDGFDALKEAAFFYLEQARRTKKCHWISFEDVRRNHLSEPRKVVPIFSMGRCGSTFFHKCLFSSGVATLSEPDVLTNLARAKLNADHPDYELAVRASLDLLKRIYPSTQSVMVKLRADLTTHISSLCNDFGFSNPIYLCRGAESWARSARRVYGFRPRHAAVFLADQLNAIRSARSNGVNLSVIWYEDLRTDAIRVLENLAVVHDSLNPDERKLQRILNEDSQAGTPLSQRKMASKQDEGEFLTHFKNVLLRQIRIRQLEPEIEFLEQDTSWKFL